MIVDRKTIWVGLQKGLITTWELSKVLVPSAMVITFLQQSGYLEGVARVFAPFMGYFGLPGEAAILLFTGYFINIYAAAGGVLALEFTAQQIAVVTVMLGFCHSLVVELAVSKKAGAPISYILPLRLGVSILAGLVMGGLIG